MPRLVMVMDPIANIKPYKDSSLAMLLAAQQRGWEMFYAEQRDLFIRDGIALANLRPVSVCDDNEDWFTLGEVATHELGDFDAILMRKDPPFDLEYIASTYILEQAEAAGALIVNKPASLRDWNEKAAIARFPQCCAPTLISRDPAQIRAFIAEQNDVILKPLDGMGGQSIFRVRENDPNLSVILETLTGNAERTTMAQQFIPEITAGDKRILLINGEPVPYALARIPAKGETRGNLAAGGRGVGQPLSERDRWIAAQLGPALREAGLLFVGIDVIGDYLTEINVTSPTCIRELDVQFGLDIAGDLIMSIDKKLAAPATG